MWEILGTNTSLLFLGFPLPSENTPLSSQDSHQAKGKGPSTSRLTCLSVSPRLPLSYPSDIWGLATAMWEILGTKAIPPLEIKDYKQSDFKNQYSRYFQFARVFLIMPGPKRLCDEELFGPGIMRKTLANWKYREYWFLKSDCL
jgi:hypothetical protein